ncbi:protein hob1-like [Pararge aegeria]|uniref:Jg11540 protein n=1 Tax=Pararge aegeria aegeria TaxID=348720 RepID=A0A8S4RNJ3_9NEOP|nr:protein hob1-like [Pararge aegeria]CAH2238262.1 jg11540 [Pararge aegeria aegeria]
MNAPVIFLLCSIVGSVVSYNVQRELPYNIDPYDPYAVEINRNFGYEPSQQLFWGNGGSNQVGGNGGLWSKITNKFPFLENMFGRMELPTQYGVPNIHQQYGIPNNPQQYAQPQQFQPQFYRGQYQQQFLPSARDVGFTDDAVIVTPPFVPIVPQPAPQPVPVPAPAPAPIPTPEPSPGYNYNKPQYRLELPRK